MPQVVNFFKWIWYLKHDKFWACLLIDLVLPIVPVVCEYMGNGFEINEKSLSIFISIYILCIGSQSRRETVKWGSVILGVFLGFYYGIVFKTPNPASFSSVNDMKESWLIMIFISFVVIGILERLNRLL